MDEFFALWVICVRVGLVGVSKLLRFGLVLKDTERYNWQVLIFTDVLYVQYI